MIPPPPHSLLEILIYDIASPEPLAAALRGLGLVAGLVTVAALGQTRELPLAPLAALSTWLGGVGLLGGLLVGWITSGGFGGVASMGMVLGAGLGALAVSVLRPDQRPGLGAGLDVVAPAGLVALAVARLGCVAEGCHVGPPCGDGAGSWCARYVAGSGAWFGQVRDGLLEASSPWSLAAWPLGLALAAASLALALVATWWLAARVRCRPPGAVAAWLVLAWLGWRMALECSRGAWPGELGPNLELVLVAWLGWPLLFGPLLQRS